MVVVVVVVVVVKDKDYLKTKTIAAIYTVRPRNTGNYGLDQAVWVIPTGYTDGLDKTNRVRPSSRHS